MNRNLVKRSMNRTRGIGRKDIIEKALAKFSPDYWQTNQNTVATDFAVRMREKMIRHETKALASVETSAFAAGMVEKLECQYRES